MVRSENYILRDATEQRFAGRSPLPTDDDLVDIVFVCMLQNLVCRIAAGFEEMDGQPGRFEAVSGLPNGLDLCDRCPFEIVIELDNQRVTTTYEHIGFDSVEQMTSE